MGGGEPRENRKRDPGLLSGGKLRSLAPSVSGKITKTKDGLRGRRGAHLDRGKGKGRRQELNVLRQRRGLQTTVLVEGTGKK